MLVEMKYQPGEYPLSDGGDANKVPDLDKVLAHMTSGQQVSGYKSYEFVDCPGWSFFDSGNCRSAHYKDIGHDVTRHFVPTVHLWLEDIKVWDVTAGTLEIGGFVRSAAGECGNCFNRTDFEYGYCENCGAS